MSELIHKIRSIMTDQGCSSEFANTLISELTGQGIVFQDVVQEWEIPEEMLLTRDQGIRVQAVDIAVRSITPAKGFSGLDGYTQKFITRAEMFEEYIRDGVNHNG